MNSFSHKKIVELVLKDYFSESDLETIKNGTVLPDDTEQQYGFVCHFYNPVTNTNYLSTEDSAKSRCIVHTADFLRSNNLIDLGQAIHYLEDICTPVHTQYEDTTDAVFRGKLHIEFEKELDKFLESYNGNHDMEFNFRNKLSLSELINYCALESAKNYYLYKEPKNAEDIKSAIYNTFELAIKAVKCFIFNYMGIEQIKNSGRKTKQVRIFKGTSIVNEEENRKGNEEEIEHIGMLIIDSENGFLDIAPTNANHRFRIRNKNEVFIFRKVSILRNFTLYSIQTL